MKRFTLTLATVMAVSMALFSSVAAASLLSMSKARSAVTKKAQQLRPAPTR